MKITKKEVAGLKKFCLTLNESQFLRFLEIIKDYTGDSLLWSYSDINAKLLNNNEKK